MARIDTIRALIEEYAQVKAEMEAFIAFENEENLLHATATIFIQLQRLPSDEKLAGGTPPSLTSGTFQTANTLGMCPKCNRPLKDGVGVNGKPYTACFQCHIFINKDKEGNVKITEMKQKQ